ncbi:MAG: M20/M25/M40 family metallo-hydrolase, partial [Bacteroidetes bacterium]
TYTFTSRQIVVEPAPADHPDPAAIARFQKAIAIPTVSLPEKVDTAAFLRLDTFIRQNFARLDTLLEKKVFNRFSRLYKWPGKNAKLDPILLMAHLDVVPVETGSLDAWEAPPFSGEMRDRYIYGRGTMDDKFSAFAILEAVSRLLQKEYIPERTVYIALGHDEETGGKHGAQAIAQWCAKENLHFDFVLDEGGFVLRNALPGLDPPLAMIGIAEKGYVTLQLTARLDEGGHASIPPHTTAIGLLAESLHRLRENPFPAKTEGAVGQMFDYVGPEMRWPYRVLFANRWCLEDILLDQLAKKNTSNALIRTTIAPTLLQAGFKDNVLPTQAQATINFRILPGETIQTVIEYVEKIIDDPRVQVEIADAGNQTEPSPVSDTNAFGFEILHTTIREIFPESVVAPSLMVAGTDSRHFAAVSDHIYRFLPMTLDPDDTKRFHGLNERIGTGDYHKGIYFYQRLIENACR